LCTVVVEERVVMVVMVVGPATVVDGRRYCAVVKRPSHNVNNAWIT
jgi:hypothetical protein